MQYGAPGRSLDTDFGSDGGFLWRASSTLLFWENVEDSCKAVGMYPVDPSSTRSAGSLALLWPLFVSLGFSQIVETMACALQGRQPVQEVGMTIFEHSLAFAEAETVVTKPMGWDSARFYKPKAVFTPDGTSLTLSRATLSSFANVPPEVLLISLISSFSHFTSNLLAITGLRAKFRLVTTAIWGLAYMCTFAWSCLRLATLAGESPVAILRFPTVCIVGFIPHLIILVGIAACGVIYLLAFGFTVLCPPPDQPPNLSWRERVAIAYGNLHANIHLSSITPLRVNWNEDFYTAILKVGFTVLTAASEAVYLNEGTKINVHSMTWLEKKRLQDLLARRRRFRQNLAQIPPELRGDMMAEGVESIDRAHGDTMSPPPTSGFARERKTKGARSSSDAATVIRGDNGVGLQQRRGRWALTYQFLRGISMLVVAIQARIVMAILQKLRITYSPRWLARLAGPRTNEKAHAGTTSSRHVYPRPSSDPYFHLDEGTRLPPDGSFDVEAFLRERLHNSGAYEERGTEPSEEHLSDFLYNWWKGGGKWGDVDTSGDYIPPQDDDTASVVSIATTADEGEWSDMEQDGQRTPTQSAYRSRRETTPSAENSLDLLRLSQLLDPKTLEEKEEAKLLSRHLQSPGILTRSRYRQVLDRDAARILMTSRYRPGGFSENVHLTQEEEEQLLEDFILTRRNSAAANGSSTGSSWNTGAEGMGSEGPQCVVCQLSPRTVLVWPCGCLSLCDDCRVGLASKNYTTCVCCRTNVVAYSRLYVP